MPFANLHSNIYTYYSDSNNNYDTPKLNEEAGYAYNANSSFGGMLSQNNMNEAITNVNHTYKFPAFAYSYVHNYYSLSTTNILNALAPPFYQGHLNISPDCANTSYKLNANAAHFVPYSSNSSFSELNPQVDEFVPRKNIIIYNSAIIGFMAAILVLSTFLIHDIISCNDKHESDEFYPIDFLRKLKMDNVNRIVFGHLNINSIRNKFENLKYLIEKNIDILLISETKLNDTFPDSQFFINGFHAPYREDRTDKGGGLLLYIHNHMPSRKIIVDFCPKIETMVIEINLKKRKWLLICSYNPHKSRL